MKKISFSNIDIFSIRFYSEMRISFIKENFDLRWRCKQTCHGRGSHEFSRRGLEYLSM